MANLFVISTPSQAFFLSQSPEFIQNAHLILTVPNATQKERILFYLEKFQWRSIYVQKKPSAGYTSYFSIFFFRCWLFWFKKRNPVFNNVFIGSYNNHYNSSIVAEYEKEATLYLLSDGMQMIAVSSLRKSGISSVRKFPSFFSFLGFKHPTIKNLTYLSPLGLEVGRNDRVYKIDKMNCSFRPKLNPKLVYFVGQPLIEMEILSKKFYFSALKKLKKFYSGKEIFYIPHPSEKKNHIKEIAEILNVKTLPHIFEEEYLRSKEFPATVASFYSSVLINLCFMKTEVELTSLMIPDHQVVSEEGGSNLKIVYDYLVELKQEVENLKILEISKL